MTIIPVGPEQKIAQVKNNTQGSQQSPSYSKGEIISAEVVSQDGEMVTLMSEGNLKFTAKIVSGMLFGEGDTLELLVQGKQNGTFVMSMVSADTDSINLSGENDITSTQLPQNISIMNALESVGLIADESNITVISEAMAQNPDLDVKSAVFMLLNKIPITKENVSALLSFESSQDLASSKLYDLAGLSVFGDNYQANTESKVNDFLQSIVGNESQTSTEQTIIQQAAEAVILNSNPESLESILNGQTQTIAGESVVLESGTTISEQNQQEGNAIISQDVINEGDIRNQQAQVINQVFAGGTEELESIKQQNAQSAGTEAEALIKNDDVKEILNKVVKSFTKIDDLISKETNIKKADLANLQKYMDIKRTIDGSDIANKSALSQKAQELISQSRVASDVKDYNFFYVPINFGENRQTAEIFVYKRGGKKAKKDGEPLTVLIGLDTQNLGRFEVLAKAYNKSLSVKIGREDEKADALIKGKTDDLRDMLSETGYTLSGITIEKLFEKTTPVNAKDVLEAAVDGRTSKIDYMA